MKMNPKIKKQWVAALRSGDYKQGKKRLRNSRGAFCCLGVLCNLHAKAHPQIAAFEKKKLEYMGCEELPPNDVCIWAGFAEGDANPFVTINGVGVGVAEHNDNGRSFAEIADAIEKQL